MKRRLWIIPVLTALIALLACGAALADQSGSCGDSLTWKLTAAGELTISGTGEMTEYSYENRPPWYASRASITSIKIENGITSLCNRAFQGCTAVTDVTVPPSVAKIDYLAFSQCSALTEVTVLNRDAVIGDNDHDVFQNCASGFTLRGFTDSTAEAYAETADHSFANPRCGSDLTWDLNSKGWLTVSGTGSMPDFSSSSFLPPWFYLRQKIKIVFINSGVTSIGQNAFSTCYYLTGMVIEDSVTSIGDWAFYSCSSLDGINIPRSLTSIGDWAFHGCESVTSLTVMSGVTSIGQDAFSDCTGLTTVTLLEGLTSIGNNAFESCTGLTGVTIPDSVTDIGQNPFAGCTSLGSIQVSGENTVFVSVGGVLYNKQKTLLLAYPAGKSGPFTVPGGVERIEYQAFSGCAGLTGVTIPNSVKGILTHAFRNCTGLTGVSLPKSVEFISHSAFEGCSGLAYASVHNTETSFSDNVFAGTPSGFILRGHSGSTAQAYAAANGHAFETLVEMSAPNFTLPAGLTRIEAEAFSGAKMTVVYIPDKVTSLGSKAFANCAGLTQIRIPASVTSIAEDAFQGIDPGRLTVFGSPGSAAEAFAGNAGFSFELE